MIGLEVRGVGVGKFGCTNSQLYSASRNSYIVLRNFQDLEPKFPYFCLPNKMGLTGFDSRCRDRARMQAGVCTALKDSYER